MASSQPLLHTTEIGTDPAEGQGGLRDLAASMLVGDDLVPVVEAPDEPVAPAPELAVGGRPGALTLSLADVIGDGGGEVVLDNQGGVRELVLQIDSPVLDQGLAEAHVTAAGEDVTGLAFVSFASGLTLYYPPEVEVAITPIV
jgi:hypothetical protein